MREHTEGPWEWSSFGDNRPALVTPDRGRLIVMDFVRLGMNGAEPRFAEREGNKGGRLIKGMTIEEIRAHPDARLIAAAPTLAARCERLYKRMVAVRAYLADDDLAGGLQQARAAIAEDEQT